MSMRSAALAPLLMLFWAAQSEARELSREFLMGEKQLPSPVSMLEFTPLDSAAPATPRFEGRLRLSRERILGSMTVLRDEFGVVALSQGEIAHLPEFDFAFVQDGSALIPKYTPGVAADREAILASHAREIAVRLPVEPIEALETDYPTANPRNFGSEEEVPATDMTAFGFVIDGAHYIGGCDTRRGTYPFCEVLDLPSYSLAKSLFAGLATMRLERLYPGVMQQRISEYVPQCSPRKGWDGVTFEHALDMATGNYTSPIYDVDERSRETSEFFIAEEHALKIHIACNQHAHRAPRGSSWVYHTTDTYILGAALSAFLRERAGAEADVYRDTLVQPLWRRLELSPVVDVTRRTRDRHGQAFTGWGLVLHRDDIARIAQFLNGARGRLDGKPFFDGRSFAAALQRDPSDRGLPSIDATFRYNNGFWAHDVSPYLGCDAPTWIPYLAGYGGINVLLLPNDTIYYYFSDGGVFRFRRAVIEANRIRPFCKAAS